MCAGQKKARMSIDSRSVYPSRPVRSLVDDGHGIGREGRHVLARVRLDDAAVRGRVRARDSVRVSVRVSVRDSVRVMIRVRVRALTLT